MQNIRVFAVLDGSWASYQPDDPQLISYSPCGRSSVVRRIPFVLQCGEIVKMHKRSRN